MKLLISFISIQRWQLLVSLDLVLQVVLLAIFPWPLNISNHVKTRLVVRAFSIHDRSIVRHPQQHYYRTTTDAPTASTTNKGASSDSIAFHVNNRNCCILVRLQEGGGDTIEINPATTVTDDTNNIAPSSRTTITAQRRKELTERTGPFWKLNSATRQIEFGTTIQLVTKLYEDDSTIESSSNPSSPSSKWNDVAEWISNPDNVSAAIWDPKLITKLKDEDCDNLYRIQVMKLQFVSLSIQPTVDLLMKTEYYNNDAMKPIFIVESICFQPNVSLLLPGITSINLDSISKSIIIEVVGRLVPTKDGTGVVGQIAFATQGILPQSLAILPEQLIKRACDAITETIQQFAVSSFQKGAKEQYNKFLNSKKIR